ncbi:site-specific integrase [Parasedimentitalea maritima]|uniref:Tyr recombinase domain-containing protein n=1 Tax=Parasedimentitalea maritima TaxID=2578117 RepID=A0A6A4RAC8_9RHOB|nr:site-specific integrase [Zongyanglinia marina]KAE9625513.1 hypothetical protein GP644_22065 [Zongyanglinia marina]
MAINVTMKHIDKRSGGKIRFRRRFPADVIRAGGQKFFQKGFKGATDMARLNEYHSHMAEYDMMVANARARISGVDERPPAIKWEAEQQDAVRMRAEVTASTSLSDDEARDLLYSGLKAQGADELTLRALSHPQAEPPIATVQDANDLYRQAKVKTRKSSVRFATTCRRLAVVLGPLDKFALVDLRRVNGRNFLEYLQTLKTVTGGPLMPKTIEREFTISAAMVAHGIVELDLEGKASNPFTKQDLPKDDVRAVEKVNPIPDALVPLVQAKRDKLKNNPQVAAIWYLLAATGARKFEIVGLMVDDINLDHDIPHIRIRPNELRGLKAGVSNREVPLLGDALARMRRLMADVQGPAVFPRV